MSVAWTSRERKGEKKWEWMTAWRAWRGLLEPVETEEATYILEIERERGGRKNKQYIENLK